MSSETVDWLKKVLKNKVKVSFDLDDEEEGANETDNFVKPKANAIKNIYTSKDLTGLQVAHDFGSFQAGQADILVLEDSNVLDGEEEGNALVSIALKEEERLKRLREVSRHARGYSGYKEYEEQAEDSIVTLGRVKTPKVLQKYDFASMEFKDEPGLVEGFRIGSQQVKPPVHSEQKQLEGSNDFDTVKSAGIEVLNLRKRKPASEIDKEKRKAKKLVKTLFADEPEMSIDQIGQIGQIEDEIKFEVEDEDDLEMQRIIAATRRDHLKMAAVAQIETEPKIEDKFIGGKSFDALMMSESIFSEKEQEEAFKVVEVMAEESTASIEDVDMEEPDGAKEEYFSSEPLVRNGVAATLALLNMRGIHLKPRSNETSKSSPSSSDIKLEYFDQFGNKLNSKEAYKELSRKFHGKGPGKGKVEKMKRRREETLKLESTSVSAATQSAIVMNLRKQQEETGAPYMILSSTRQIESTPSVKQENEVKKPKIFGLQLNKN